jgi:hypothetical protein
MLSEGWDAKTVTHIMGLRAFTFLAHEGKGDAHLHRLVKRVLHDHLIKGYTTNTYRLAELKQTIRLVSDVAMRRALTSDEATALLGVVRDYAAALDVLDAYDHRRLPEPTGSSETAKPITLEEARRFIAAMREHFGGSALFGQERDGGDLPDRRRERGLPECGGESRALIVFCRQKPPLCGWQ